MSYPRVQLPTSRTRIRDNLHYQLTTQVRGQMQETSSVQLSLLLTTPEIRELTEYARPALQKMRLDEMGVPYVIGRTGSPRVFRAALERWMLPGCAKTRHSEPKYSALNEV